MNKKKIEREEKIKIVKKKENSGKKMKEMNKKNKMWFDKKKF